MDLYLFLIIFNNQNLKFLYFLLFLVSYSYLPMFLDNLVLFNYFSGFFLINLGFFELFFY